MWRMPTFIPKENHGFEPKNVVKYMLFAAKTKSMLSSEFSIFNCTYCLMVYRMLLRCFKMKMISNYQLSFCKGQIIYKILSFLQIFLHFHKDNMFHQYYRIDGRVDVWENCSKLCIYFWEILRFTHINGIWNTRWKMKMFMSEKYFLSPARRTVLRFWLRHNVYLQCAKHRIYLGISFTIFIYLLLGYNTTTMPLRVYIVYCVVNESLILISYFVMLCWKIMRDFWISLLLI